MDCKMKGMHALSAVALLAAFATAPVQAVTVTTLTLTGPVADADQIQQTAQTPSIFAGAVPTQPADFGWEQFPSGGSSTTYDATTGTGAVDWENAATGGSGPVPGPDYTVQQIMEALGGESSFFVGIDTNTTAADSEVLQLFEVSIDQGLGFSVEFNCGTAANAACGAIAPPNNNGTGFSDFLLGTVDLSTFASTDLVQFRTIITGAVDGQEQLFLIQETAVVPVPAAVWLFGSGLLGLVGVARRKKR